MLHLYFNKISLYFLYRTPLQIAVEKGIPEIVKILLTNSNINVNSHFILKHNIFYSIQITHF